MVPTDPFSVSQGSVVLRPVPEFTRCSGVPAKVTSVLRQHKANLEECKAQGQAHFIELLFDPQLTS